MFKKVLKNRTSRINAFRVIERLDRMNILGGQIIIIQFNSIEQNYIQKFMNDDRIFIKLFTNFNILINTCFQVIQLFVFKNQMQK